MGKIIRNLFYFLTLGTLLSLGSQKLKAQSTDDNPPVVQVRSHPTTPNDTSDIWLNIDAIDGQSGIKSLKLYLDGNIIDSLDFAEPYENNQGLTKLINGFWPPPDRPWGTHGYHAVAIDGSNNIGRDPPSGEFNTESNLDNDWPLIIDRSTISVNPGWALVSLPNNATTPLVSQMFPNAVSLAHGFSDEGYYSTDTLEIGKSYWVKFNNISSVDVVGDSINRNQINVKKGWNLIGTKSNFVLSIPVENISSNPPGLIGSKFYYHDRGYKTAENLNRGQGYWIYSNSDGNLIINENAVSNLESRVNNELLPPPTPFEEKQKDENYVFDNNNGFTFKYPSGFSGISIYDILGREVKRISQSSYMDNLNWDLKDDKGNLVPNGVYLFRILDGEKILQTGKLAKIK